MDGDVPSTAVPAGSPIGLQGGRMHPEVKHLRQLPIAEKRRVVQELWDDIGKSAESFPLPQWHRVEADRRAAELDADPTISLSRE